MLSTSRYRMKGMKGLVLAALVIVSLVAAACAAPAAPTSAPSAGGSTKASSGAAKRIALVTPYMANATTKQVIDLFSKYAKEKGWEVGTTDTAGDFDKLVGAIQNAVAQKVDAIVLGMGDPAQMSKGLTAAKEANIPVFGIDAGVAPDVVANITSDNAALGTMSAEDLAQRIGKKGNIVMFTHDPHPGVNARAKAAAAVFEKYPDIKVIDKRHVNVPGPVDNARKIMQDLLTARPEKGSIAGAWAGWDEPALGATQAILAAGRTEMAVVGVDGTDFAKAEIKKGGPFKSTVEQDWDGIARKTVELVGDYFQGKKLDRNLYTLPGKLITPENLK
ncbi:MAG: substrate-binding domain-containing protein [Dehalococcoidales bacterium]|nr:substrate-binding domain-containing protein [Dehalococcoidales bacterium]